MKPQFSICSGLAFTAYIVFVATANAQRQQPRCQGWPPERHTTSYKKGLVIGEPGQTCYGAFINSLRDSISEILSISVLRAPSQGRLVMTGVRDFAYTPNAQMRGFDDIEISIHWRRLNREWDERRTLRATTTREYLKAGGTPTRWPD
jgi:hypothetical protein